MNPEYAVSTNVVWPIVGSLALILCTLPMIPKARGKLRKVLYAYSYNIFTYSIVRVMHASLFCYVLAQLSYICVFAMGQEYVQNNQNLDFYLGAITVCLKSTLQMLTGLII